jgi:hypothetical protein
MFLIIFSIITGIFYIPLYLASWILFVFWNFVVIPKTELIYLSQPEIFTGLLSSIILGYVVRAMFGKVDLSTKGTID